MSRTFVIGDIHSCYIGLMDIIGQIQPKKEDTLIFLGDYTDGWSDAVRTLKYMMYIENKLKCQKIWLWGNHDVWLYNWLTLRESNPAWEKSGGMITKYVIKKEIDKNPRFQEKVVRFYNKFHDYYHDKDTNRLYVHGGFKGEKLTRKEDRSSFLWDRSLLQEATWRKEKGWEKPARLEHYHEVFIGHTSTMEHKVSMPMNFFNLWNMDTGAGWHGRLCAMNVETKKVYKTKRSKKLYPQDPHGKVEITDALGKKNFGIIHKLRQLKKKKKEKASLKQLQADYVKENE